MEIVISKSKKLDKQFDSRIYDKNTVSFGQKGAQDYTKHKDKERKDAYVNRHKNEDWTESGVKAAEWMSKRVLLNKPALHASVANMNKQFKSSNVKMKPT